jgi:hypothetical protein
MPDYDFEVRIICDLDQVPTREALKSAFAPTFPTDDGLLEFEANGGSADDLAGQLENEFTGEVCGLSAPEVRKITAHAAKPTVFAKVQADDKHLEDLNDRLVAIISTELSRAFIPLRAERIVAKRKEELAKRAPLRRQKIMEILRPLRTEFKTITPGIEDRFHSLSAAMERCVVDQIIAQCS